ncbi:D-alanyl-D-alanine-carboxypeptidase/endopeptidase AmpH-like [Biomphalaria glabrata]|uniref:D-alanyl-D-alanine- carboxypeptidase/endopeptidase AmpH-like n=1 Tax=Biomphalaria glabrata TaxID=6526 RepID=A0A9U8EKA8_BIOGL|nr:D-alanyl-D-alanine-carboxypeptidase/endopeptidase AmpH-like [Biomphalaria glabrata]
MLHQMPKQCVSCNRLLSTCTPIDSTCIPSTNCVPKHQVNEIVLSCLFLDTMWARSRTFFFTVTLMYVTLFHSCCSQEDVVEFDQEDVDRVVLESFNCHENPALAVAVVKDGKVLLSRGYGTFDKDTNKPVTNSSVFGVASLTKVFTSTVFLKLLLEKTNLTVNSPIRKLLGDEFQMVDQVRTQEASFADLLSHKMGIPDNNMLRFDPNFTRENLLKRLPYMNSSGTFRANYYYSNMMYGLVARLTELLGNSSWEQLVTEQLLRPLGMDSSTFASVTDFNREDIVTAYEKLDSNFVKVHPEFSRRWAQLPGSGSFMTSANDMAKWMNFHLSGGRNSQGDAVVPEKVLTEINQPRFYAGNELCKEIDLTQFPLSCSDNIFCFGLRSGHYRGYQRLTHTGSTRGYRAVVSLLPTHKVGVFLALTNKDDLFKYRNPLLMYLTDRALGFRSWLNISTICSYPKPWKNTSSPSNQTGLVDYQLHHEYSIYEGTYFNTLYGSLTIHYNKSLSSLEMNYGWGRWTLKPISSGAAQQFHAQGLDINQVYNTKPISFLYSDPGTIKAINATGFVPLQPPIFDKMASSLNSSSQIVHGILEHLLLMTLLLCLMNV